MKQAWKSALLVICKGIHRWPVNSWLEWLVTRKKLPFDDVIMCSLNWNIQYASRHYAPLSLWCVLLCIRIVLFTHNFQGFFNAIWVVIQLHQWSDPAVRAQNNYVNPQISLHAHDKRKHKTVLIFYMGFPSENHLNSNLAKSRSSITFVAVVKSFWKFAQITALILSCSVQNFERNDLTIEQ